MQYVEDVAVRALILTLEELVLILGPIALLALILRQLARYIRNRVAWTVKFDAYTYLTAPGVAVHELGHAFFCVVFRHRIVKIKLFQPEKDGTLGYVQHTYNPASTYQKIGNFFIGTGPLWFGTAAVYLLSCLLLAQGGSTRLSTMPQTSTVPLSTSEIASVFPAVGETVWDELDATASSPRLRQWTFWVGIYLVFCIGSHITLSRPDMNGAARGFLLFVAALLFFNVLLIGAGERSTSFFNARLMEYLVILYTSGVIILTTNLCLAGITGALYRIIRSGRHR